MMRIEKRRKRLTEPKLHRKKAHSSATFSSPKITFLLFSPIQVTQIPNFLSLSSLFNYSLYLLLSPVLLPYPCMNYSIFSFIAFRYSEILIVGFLIPKFDFMYLLIVCLLILWWNKSLWSFSPMQLPPPA